MDFKRPLIAVIVLAAGAAAAYFLLAKQSVSDSTPRAWGFVDTRSVSLAFERSARIVKLTREEGDRVHAGDVLGLLDTTALTLEQDRLKAQIEGLKANLSLVKEGPRAEDIAAARAQLAAARAELKLAELTAKRQEALFKANASAAQMRDQARQTLVAKTAQVESLTAGLKKLEAGSRPQEIAAAQSNLAASEAQLATVTDAILRQSVLVAPTDAVVRSRLAEPGDMAGPGKTVYRLSIDNPKWVRAYLTESRLNEIHTGDIVTVKSDISPELKGRISFISDTAEFTPKTVQTEELRTALVYEFKVEVTDPEGVLRLGQPVTVLLEP